MILRGPEYLESDQKRWLDQLLCRALGIVATPVRDYTARRLADELGLVLSEVHMQQARKSQAGDVVIPKLRTLPVAPNPDAPLIVHGAHDPRAGRFGLFARHFGLDEIPQFGLIPDTLSFVGIRPQVAEDWAACAQADPALFEVWSRLPGRAGLISPSSNWRRGVVGTGANLHIASMEQDIHWAATTSLAGDVTLLARSPFEVSLRMALPKVVLPPSGVA